MGPVRTGSEGSAPRVRSEAAYRLSEPESPFQIWGAGADSDGVTVTGDENTAAGDVCDSDWANVDRGRAGRQTCEDRVLWTFAWRGVGPGPLAQ